MTTVGAVLAKAAEASAARTMETDFMAVVGRGRAESNALPVFLCPMIEIGTPWTRHFLLCSQYGTSEDTGFAAKGSQTRGAHAPLCRSSDLLAGDDEVDGMDRAA